MTQEALIRQEVLRLGVLTMYPAPIGIQTDRNGNIVPVKNQSAKHRIDGAASMLDAYVGLLDHYQELLRMSK